MTSELQKELEDWQDIYRTFLFNKDAAEIKMATKDERCGLCPKYKKETVLNNVKYLSCRECPIVKMTRRTCGFWWSKNNVEPGSIKGEDSLKTYLFLKKIINGEITVEKEVN
jgi:hypothetical protein